MRKIEQVSVPKTVVLCDFCGHECRGHRCFICGKDVCVDCAVCHDIWWSDLRNANAYDGDHPEYICKPCWERGKEIRHKIMELREAKERQEEELINKWKVEVPHDG